MPDDKGKLVTPVSPKGYGAPRSLSGTASTIRRDTEYWAAPALSGPPSTTACRAGYSAACSGKLMPCRVVRVAIVASTSA